MKSRLAPHRDPDRPWLELAGDHDEQEQHRRDFVRALRHFEARSLENARKAAEIADVFASVDAEMVNQNGRRTGDAFLAAFDLVDAANDGRIEDCIHKLYGTENDYAIGEHVAGKSIAPS